MPGLMNENVSAAVAAHAGGGQGSATVLSDGTNRVSTVASAADSVRLPSAASVGDGDRVYVVNAHASNSLNVFPATGEVINALAANAAFALAAGKSAQFTAIGGQWYTLLSA